jgi:type III secretion system YscD/HrpQ family protein
MVARLLIEEGDLKGLSLSLEEGDSWTVGRDPDECQLVIEDPLVSRKHFITRRSPEGFVVENLSTTNPLLVNDEEINAPRLLQNGDTLKIGNELLRFYENASARVLDEGTSDAEFNEIENPSPEEGDIIFESEEPTPPTPTAIPTPPPLPSPPQPPISEQPPRQDTIFEDEDADLATLAEIDFGVIETGRWLLKVIGGPNNGAEFYMQASNNYLLGTDPQSCDIVFHDTSVSRQHARIIITPEDELFIEDLKSRNGVLMNGTLIEGRQTLIPNTIITLGTTSFVIYDREGEMQTIISPLLPSIVKMLQQEPAKKEAPATTPIEPEMASIAAPAPAPTPPPIVETPPPPKPSRRFGPSIILAAIIGLFILAGIGTSTLFQEKPVIVQVQENTNELIQHTLQPFPAVRWTFNKSNGSLLLLGHVSTLSEKNQLLYKLGNLKFIKSIDDQNIIIDEGVLNEVNSLLSSNPTWRGITIYSPAAGQFILSGELKTRKQAEQLSSYLSLNFPYLDLLKKHIVVEEDVINQITAWLHHAQLSAVVPKMSAGEVTLTGTIPAEEVNQLNDIIAKIKQIPGVRIVANLVSFQTAETGVINISEHYPVTGQSRIGNKYTVVINGRILSEGDDLDGMTITQITAHHIMLERGGDKFRIDY